MTRTLEDILQSTSDVLFPAELGEKQVRLDSCDVDGDTPLHVMTWRQDLEAVQMLISAGADVNAVGDMGETPLHVAVSQEADALIVALITAGANPHIRSEFGKAPSEEAALKGGAVERAFIVLPNQAFKPTGHKKP